MIRILLADDHPIIFSGLEALLRGTEYRIVRYVREGADVLAAVETEDPDIVVLDERLADTTGLELFRELRKRGDTRPVILLTGTIPEQRAIEAVEAGISGLVLKHEAPDSLLACLEKVRGGGRWIEQGLLDRASDRMARGVSEDNPFAPLTRRERSVVDLVGENLRNQEIAARLNISEATVKVHLHNVYEKLGLENRTDLLMLIRDLRTDDNGATWIGSPDPAD